VCARLHAKPVVQTQLGDAVDLAQAFVHFVDALGSSGDGGTRQ
jgi:hypothetical protein